MKIMIDISEGRYKDIRRIAEVQLKRNHFQTAEQIIANGAPVDTSGDYISRQAAIDVVEKWFNKIQLNGDICCDGIRSLPSVEPERKTGKWVHMDGWEEHDG